LLNRHAENAVAVLHQREEDGLVRLRAGVRLHVRETAIEQLASTRNRQLLRLVDLLAAAIVPALPTALGILVRQYRALRLEHRARHDVLRGDQLDLMTLPLQ